MNTFPYLDDKALLLRFATLRGVCSSDLLRDTSTTAELRAVSFALKERGYTLSRLKRLAHTGAIESLIADTPGQIICADCGTTDNHVQIFFGWFLCRSCINARAAARGLAPLKWE